MSDVPVGPSVGYRVILALQGLHKAWIDLASHGREPTIAGWVGGMLQ